MSNWLPPRRLVRLAVEGLEEALDAGQGAEVALQGESLAAGRLDLADHAGRGFGVLLVVDGHERPVAGQAEGDCPADATAGAGHEGDFSLQAHVSASSAGGSGSANSSATASRKPGNTAPPSRVSSSPTTE